MLVGTPQVMCTAVKEPKEWSMGGRTGVTYKVTISDGASALELPVNGAETWALFKPFSWYMCTVEVSQVAKDNRIDVTARIVDAKEVKPQ